MGGSVECERDRRAAGGVGRMGGLGRGEGQVTGGDGSRLSGRAREGGAGDGVTGSGTAAVRMRMVWCGVRRGCGRGCSMSTTTRVCLSDKWPQRRQLQPAD